MTGRNQTPCRSVASPPRRTRGGRSTRAGRAGALLLGVATAGLIGCGGGTGDAIIVRVGAATITMAMLEHSMEQLAPEHAVPEPPLYRVCIHREETVTLLSLKAEFMQECKRQYRALRLQALNNLISSRWVIGEAEEKGLAHGAHDASLQAKTELASASIRRALLNAEPQITRARVAREYRREITNFRIPERRDFEIFEHIPSEAAAWQVRAQVKAGHRDVAVVHLHEYLTRPASFDVGASKAPITIAIFAASQHALSEPVPLNGQYALFELTKITPPGIRPLARVGKSIRSRLAREQRRRTLARFIVEWRKRWKAKTNCAPGYVVQKCREYPGPPRRPEDPLALR